MRDIPGLSSDVLARAVLLSAKARQAREDSPVPTPKASLSTPKVEDGVATIRLYDFIDQAGGPWGVSADEFATALDEVGAVDSIVLRINSGGGSVWDGLAILNNLRSNPAKVTAVVDGMAASAASFIAVACDEVVMMPNSKLMIHDAMGICLGQAVDMREYADFLDESSNNVAEIYAARAGGSAEEWRGRMVAKGLLGQWYSAADAVTAGLADRVEGTEPEARVEPEPQVTLTLDGEALAASLKTVLAEAEPEPEASPDRTAQFMQRRLAQRPRGSAA